MIHKYIKIINYVIYKVHLIFQLFSKSIQKVNRQIIRVNLQNDTKLYCVSFAIIFMLYFYWRGYAHEQKGEHLKK